MNRNQGLEIQEVRGVKGFIPRINSLLDALPRRSLKKPVHRGRRIQDDHRSVDPLNRSYWEALVGRPLVRQKIYQQNFWGFPGKAA